MDTKEYQKNYRETHRERFKEYQKSFYKKHKKEVNAKNNERYSKDIEVNRAKKRAAAIKRKYNLTQEEYKTLIDSVGNKCEICNSKSNLCIDHCHKTGRIRGILCRRCNITLSYIESNDVKKYEQYLKNSEVKDKEPLR